MDKENVIRSGDIVGKSYAELAYQSLRSCCNEVKEMIDHRQIPKEPWEHITIKIFLAQIAAMDSNNFKDSCGVGEREGRIFSQFVRERNHSLGHGIGRSGDVNAIQPKAIGSSLVVQLTKYLVLHAFKIMGLTCIKDALVLPLATGMAISLTLLTLKAQYPKREYVIFSRIDQKTCLKAIITANLIPIVIDPIEDGDELTTDIEGIEKALKENEGKILCVYCTTSCFAPRGYDKITEVAKLCKEYDVGHFINNAYGLQCSKICNEINLAHKNGRVDVLVSSTDKNFMVPVGGSIVYGANKKGIVEKVNKNYPGRASNSAVIDLFLTLVEMGQDKLKELLNERKENYKYLFQKLEEVLPKYGERVLISKHNKISIASTLMKLPEGYDPTFFGSYMFSRRISGLRVIKHSKQTELGGVKFKNYGSSSENYTYLPYFTTAAALGMSKKEIDIFAKRLDEALDKIHKKEIPLAPFESPSDQPPTSDSKEIESTIKEKEDIKEECKENVQEENKE